MTIVPDRPLYADLPGGRAVGLYGPDEQLGALNLLTPGRVAAAAALVRTGEIFSLNASLYYPSPHPASSVSRRRPPTHVVHRSERARDDLWEGLFTQYSSQWDGFLHVRDVEHGCFYNGNTDESRGIEAWAERGIAGRGVLLDVARWLTDQGRELDWRTDGEITVADLEDCARAQGVAIDEGTILLIRTGWETGFTEASYETRAALATTDFRCPGIEPSPAMLAYLWDSGVAAVAADNFTLEPFPFREPWMHADLLNRLGIPIGEFWHLDDLADACKDAGRFDFLFTSAPLNGPGTAGSPANALAIL
ncbi:cyclase family protein [Nocardioides sp. NPDC101246]|uniref:cyclase family protein n=1 Tax=Nocardioides sp. NPDC101246 TaxID=3364336 RepID=UPI00381BABA2